MAQKLVGVPGGAELWRVDRMTWIVYRTPKHGVPIAYQVTGGSQNVRALFDDGQVRYARQFNSRKAATKATGVMLVGHRSELSFQGDHPFRPLLAKYQRLLPTNPWLKDPEVLALYASAILEGRSITESELASTGWFRKRTKGEREWAVLSMSDPQTADQIRSDNRTMVRQTLRSLGVHGFSEGRGSMLEWLTNQWTTGKWTQSHLTEQLRRLADPFRGPLDKDLRNFFASKRSLTGGRPSHLTQTREHEDTVRDLVSEWLGPHVAETWSDRKVREWAGRLRNNPNAQQNLIDSLRKQRLSKYKSYDDINTTYADIDALWRPVVRGLWGVDIKHGDPTYERILRLNDAAEAEKTLRQEGLRRGVRQVGLNLLSELHRTLGGSVRRMV